RRFLQGRFHRSCGGTRRTRGRRAAPLRRHGGGGRRRRGGRLRVDRERRRGGRLRDLGRLRPLRWPEPRRRLRTDRAGARGRAIRDRHPGRDAGRDSASGAALRSAGTATARLMRGDRAEYLLDERTRLPERILADLVLLVCDAAEQAVEGLRGHVIVEIRVLRWQQPELRRLAGVLVVFCGQAELGDLSRDDRLELPGQLRAGGAAEVLRAGVIAAGEDAPGIRTPKVLQRPLLQP